MKLRKENKYYSLDKILSKDCDYNLIIGERSNGKTYALLEYSIKQFYTKGEQTALLRRWKEDIRVAIVEDGQRYLFDYKEEQLEAYTEQTAQDTDTTANTSDLQDNNTAGNEVHEEQDTAVKKDIVEGNTATTNTAKNNTVQPTIQQDNLIQSLNNLVDLHGCYLEAKKEYIAVKKDGYKGTVCMIRNCRYGNGIHIDMKSKIWIALDEEYRQVVSKDHYTGIYDKTRKLFRIGYVRDLDILQVVILTALQLAS